ncbi:retrovirus-related pol polyprotein from transposon TNT 1-94 [Tanacetum coccineum]
MKKTRNLTKVYGVTPTIVLRRNIFKARHVTQQDYGVTTHHGFVGDPFDYRVTLDFGSIAGGLDPVNLVIRLPIERGINIGTREVRVKALRSDNETEFKNHKLEEFYDEKGISQNFSSPCPEQNGVAKRRNRTLIEAARTMCLVHIHNHRDHLGKFNEKVDDGFFLDIQQSLVPQDKWSREKRIKLVNIIGKPLAGITTRSRVIDSKAVSAYECLYVNFLSRMEPKKLIEALEEEGWIIAMQESESICKNKV